MNKEEKVFLTGCWFLISTSFVYVFSGILGLNLPRYYPQLGVWSIKELTGPSMGYYAKVGFTFLLSLPLSFLFYLFLPWMAKFKKFNPDFWRGMAISSLLWGMMFFLAEEWHKWVIEKQKLSGGGFFNPELGFFLFVLGLFLFFLKLVVWVEKKVES